MQILKIIEYPAWLEWGTVEKRHKNIMFKNKVLEQWEAQEQKLASDKFKELTNREEGIK